MVADRDGEHGARRCAAGRGLGREPGPAAARGGCPGARRTSDANPGGTRQMNQIPLVDLKAAHEEVADEVRAGFTRILARTAFVGGDEVRLFEGEYADFG